MTDTNILNEVSLSDLRDGFSLDPFNNDIISTVMNDADDVFGWIQRGQKNISVAAVDQEEANNFDKVAELDNDFRQLLDLEQRVRNQKTTLAQIKANISNGQKYTDLLVPYEALQLELGKKYATDEAKYFTNQKYISFKQNIWNINHPDELMPKLGANDDDDDDIVMGSTKISLKCPITTSWLENPVTSTDCQHTFSKDAIVGLLARNNGAINCPIPGCNKYIKRNMLQDNEVMAARVIRAKARDEQKTSNTQFFEVE